MASSNSLANTNKIKIAGIGEYPKKGYLKNLKLSEHYDILERFKTFEDKIWRVPDTETTQTTDYEVCAQTRAFIDKLLFIIHNEIRYPKQLNDGDGLTETKNANELVNLVKKLIKGRKSSNNNNKTIGETLDDLKTKSGNPELFDTFLCCLLMSEPPSKEDKTLFFGGVFKSWGWLQQLDQVEGTKFAEFLIKIKEFINREQRTFRVTLGFQSIKYFINNEANKNLLMGKLDSTSQKEEAILEQFYEWICKPKKAKMKITDFTNCYVNIKCEHLPKFDEYTNIRNLTNENFKKHLEWEIKSFDFLNLSRLTSTTENVVSNLQVQLVDLWKKVKDIVNDRSVLENSNKGTLQRNLYEVPCSLDKLKLKCLQINLNRSEDAWNQVVDQWLKNDETVHIVFIQEPCIKKMEITRPDVKETKKKDYCYYFPNLPTNYRAIHNAYLIDQELANAGIFIAAILVHENVSFERILPMDAFHDQYNYPQELMAGIRLTGQGWNGVTLFSIYCRPIRSLAMALQPLRLLLTTHDMTPTVLCMDANATHPKWSPAHENTGLYSGRGEDLEYFRTSCKLKVANQNFKNVKKENNQPKRDDAENKPKPKHIDVTFYRGDHIYIKNWKRLKDKSLSDHRYITFSIQNYSEEAKNWSPLLSSFKSLSMPCLGWNKVSSRSPNAEV